MNSLRIHEIFQKIPGFHWIFEKDFLNSLGSGGAPPIDPSTKCICPYFPKLLEQFSRKVLYNYLKNMKNGENSIKTMQKLKVSIDFSTQSSLNSLPSGCSAPELPRNAYFQIFVQIFAKNSIKF